MVEQKRRPRSFGDVWQKLHPDSVEISVKQAAMESGLAEATIRYRLRKGRGARGREIQVGKRKCWVVERDSLAPPNFSERPREERPILKKQGDSETDLGRARRKAGLDDDGLAPTREAGASVGISSSAVCYRLKKGTAEGRKVGRFWLVKKDSLAPSRYSKASAGVTQPMSF